MIREYFAQYLELYPSFGSFIGYDKYNNRYENHLDPSLKNNFLQMNKLYLAKLKNRVQTIDDALLRWIIDIHIEGAKYKLDLMPLTSFRNIIIDFVFINENYYPLKTSRDLKHLVQRYEDFHQVIVSAKGNMKKGMKVGYVIPKMICKKMIRYLKDHIKNKEYIIMVPDNLQNTFSKQFNIYLNVLNKHSDAIEDIIKFLEEEYYPACRTSIGLCDLPNGKKLYEYTVKTELTIQVDISAIHQFGKSEIKRLSQEMDKLKIELGYAYDCSLKQFYQDMLVKYKIGSKHKILQKYKKKRDDIRTSIIPQYFSYKVQPYEIKAVPSNIESISPAAFYVSGNRKRDRIGTFYVNLANTADTSEYSITSLSLHEGEPGHHYQFQYMLEKGLPAYRMYLLKASSLAEGWALYAENFTDKTNKIDYFGKLSFELFRSARLVVDTGIHYYGWSHRKAVHYMKSYVPLSHKQIEAEIDRYICMPAQALCYKIGEREILKWRQMYTDKYGRSEESLRRFHTILLEDGNLPLQVLENKIKNGL